ncbi:MAG: glycosyl hydrolase family 28 protein, partial [Asticcacaulis sp.]
MAFRPRPPAGLPAWADPLRADLEAMAVRLTASLKPWSGPRRVHTPEGFGYVKGQLATAAIQAAIDAASARGGGTVRLKRGDYVSGTLTLRDNIRLDIAKGARLLGSLDLKDWPEHVAKRRTVQDTNMGMNQSLIFAEGCRNIALSGGGEINGRGDQFHGDETIHGTPGRPFLLRIIACADIHVSGLSLIDSPCWMQNYLNCDNLLIEDLTVVNQANWNNDGCDIDGCRNVIVRRLQLQFRRRRHVLQGRGPGADRERTGRGLHLRQSVQRAETRHRLAVCVPQRAGAAAETWRRHRRHAPFQAGRRHFRHFVGNRRRAARPRTSWPPTSPSPTPEARCSSGSTTAAASSPTSRKPPAGTLRRIVFDRISGRDNGPRGSFFTGIPARRIADIVLRDIDLHQQAATTSALDQAAIPELYNVYPDAEMLKDYGNLAPAYGLWARHVENLSLINVRFTPDGCPIRAPWCWPTWTWRDYARDKDATSESYLFSFPRLRGRWHA